ncbi:MAG: chorismate synthase [Flavobacteriales bacterium]
MSNTFGKIFCLTTYGESHGIQIGGIIDGCPSGIPLDLDAIQKELDRRKPGQSEIVSPRKEEDIVHFHSGIFDGCTTGTPIQFTIYNKDQRSKDYGNIANIFRPSHADYTYQKKYGIRDYRGGGRSSARETACRVVAGAIAKQLLLAKGIRIRACVKSVHQNKLAANENIEWPFVEQFKTRAANQRLHNLFESDILEAKEKGDSLGGQVHCEIIGAPVGLGEPIYDKLHARLGSAMLSINACKGFEIGSGFLGTTLKGSEHNDSFQINGKQEISTVSNFSGGVQGGISNGEPIYFAVAFKPTATIIKPQKSVTNQNKAIEFLTQGRHDPCVLPRAVPVVEAMAAITMLDFILLNKSRQF